MLEERKRVNVYRNLRKAGIQYSVAQGGTVRQYEHEVMLKDVRNRSSERPDIHHSSTYARGSRQHGNYMNRRRSWNDDLRHA